MENKLTRIRDRKPPEIDPVDRAKREKALEAAAKEEVGRLAKFLVEDPVYLLDLQERLRNGTLHPMLQQLLWNYAYGKPKERVEIKHAAVVKIVHEFAQGAKVVEGEVVKQPEEIASGQ